MVSAVFKTVRGALTCPGWVRFLHAPAIEILRVCSFLGYRPFLHCSAGKGACGTEVGQELLLFTSPREFLTTDLRHPKNRVKGFSMDKKTEKVSTNKTQGKKIKVYCEECKTTTNQEVIQSVDVDGCLISYDYDENERGSIEWVDNYQIIKCQGCDLITFRHENWFSESYFPEVGEDGTTVHLYPERSSDTRIEKEFNNLPSLLRTIYSETVDCYNNDSQILCAAGMRAIIEGICAEQKIDDGPVFKEDGITPVRSNSLGGKIAGLHEKGMLTKACTDILHEHRFLGNDAIHELQVPTKEVLGLAMDIIEHMFDDLYEIPDKAEDLRQKRARQMKKS